MDTRTPNAPPIEQQRAISERARIAKKQREKENVKSALRSNLRRRKKPQKTSDEG